ncbi:AAA family ATPase [Flavobacterium sp. SE-s27]|uniref:Shikimate kinase n=1 Tax=Flavobacterium solisilvae TaxID=1852019 RepID=A0ABX1QV05_9FLAO|nr:AAA family ATPase [Flavobacterium solisilvae]
MNKIVLIGYMGVGKTVLGKKISENLKLAYYDLDDFIEKKVNLSVEDIFKSKGEIYFRRIERDCFEELMLKDESFVLSVGGGTPCYYENYKLLQDENVISVYLKASITMLVERLKTEKKTRPLVAQLTDEQLLEFVGKHLFERNFYYNKAKYTVEVDGKSISKISEEIISLLG